MMSSNVLNLHYSDDENINDDDRQDSNQSLRLLSSISPSKKRLSKLSPDKLNHVSPNKRVPLELKSNNHILTNTHRNKSIINSKNLDANAKRKLLRKNITVTKTGSFAATKNTTTTNKLKSSDNGLIRYKSLVLDEFSEARDDEDKEELDNFWINKKLKNSAFGIEEENDDYLSLLDTQSKSVQKMMNSNNKITLDDDLEFVPNKPAETDLFLDEKHSVFTKEDKRKLNEFNAPFGELHTDKTKITREFMIMNEKAKNNINVDDSESTDIKNPYKTEEVDFSSLDAFDNFIKEHSLQSRSGSDHEDRITEQQFDNILEENGYTNGSIDLDF